MELTWLLDGAVEQVVEGGEEAEGEEGHHQEVADQNVIPKHGMLYKRVL